MMAKVVPFYGMQDKDNGDEEPDGKETIFKLARISKIVNFVRDVIGETVFLDSVMTRSLRYRCNAKLLFNFTKNFIGI